MPAASSSNSKTLPIQKPFAEKSETSAKTSAKQLYVTEPIAATDGSLQRVAGAPKVQTEHTTRES